MNIEEVEFGGWKKNLRLSNENIELVVTLEVGPRVLFFAPVGGKNLFHVFDDHLGGTGEATWQSRGGHRFWVAPESDEDDPFTYFPDNAPVQYEQVGNAVRFTPPAETTNGWQKEIEISLDGPNVEITHRLENIGEKTVRCAPWAISVMAAGGVATVEQPALGSHPENLLPNRTLVLWPYTDLTDPRLKLGRDRWEIAHDAARGPLKIGLNHDGGVDGAGTSGDLFYKLDGVVFSKKFARVPGATYPDNGCNCEIFTNEEMLELESLGPIVDLAPGETTELRESWAIAQATTDNK